MLANRDASDHRSNNSTAKEGCAAGRGSGLGAWLAVFAGGIGRPDPGACSPRCTIAVLAWSIAPGRALETLKGYSGDEMGEQEPEGPRTGGLRCQMTSGFEVQVEGRRMDRRPTDVAVHRWDIRDGARSSC